MHWLVDDTNWDQRSPAHDIGAILRNPREATAVAAVLDPLLAILDQLGPTASNDDHLTHPHWPQTALAARQAHQLLTNQTPNQPEH